MVFSAPVLAAWTMAGLVFLLPGIFLLLRRFSLRLQMLLFLAGGLLASFPFFLLSEKPSPSGPVYSLTLRFPVQLTEGQIGELGGWMRKEKFLTALPAGMMKDLELKEGDFPAIEWTPSAYGNNGQESVCRLRFRSGLNEQAEKTLAEYAFTLFHLLILDGARAQGFQGQEQPPAVGGDFNKWRGDWEPERPRLGTPSTKKPRSKAPPIPRKRQD